MRWISDSPNESTMITIKWFLWSHTQQTIQMFAVVWKSGFWVCCCLLLCHVNMQGVHEASTSTKLLSSPCDYVLCTSHQRTTSFGPNPKLVVSSCHYIMRKSVTPIQAAVTSSVSATLLGGYPPTLFSHIRFIFPRDQGSRGFQGFHAR